MLSLSSTYDDVKLTPIATLSYSSQGVGKDPLVDLDGILIYLNKDYKEEKHVVAPIVAEKKVFESKFPGVLRGEETKVSEDFLKRGRDGRRITRTDLLDMRSILDKVPVNKSFVGKTNEHHFTRMLEKAKAKEEEMEKNLGKSIQLNEGSIFPLPIVKRTKEGEKKFRQVYHLAARSDAGKSTHASKIMRLWKHMREELDLPSDIFIFSRVEADNAYKGLGAYNILIDEELLANPIDPKNELQDCMVVFDDIDKILDKTLRDYVMDLRNGILQTGAHTGTYVINTCHHLSDWGNTRDALNEAHLVTLFPIADKVKIKAFMVDKLGVEKKKAEDIVNLPTRWLTFCVLFPSYVIYESGIILL